MANDNGVPSRVAELADRARNAINETYGVDLDVTPETLPIVDEFVRSEVVEATRDAREELVVAIGCYFGEVIRRKLDGRWTHVDDQPPSRWRLELTPCFLHLCPIGMAAEAVAGCEVPDYDGSFATLDELREALDERLMHHPPVSEAEYYSLTGRIDILTLVADWLIGRDLANGKTPRTYTASDYSARLDAN